MGAIAIFCFMKLQSKLWTDHVLDPLWSKGISYSVSDLDCYIIRKLLDSVFDVLPALMPQWEIHTFSQFLPYGCLHKAWHTLVHTVLYHWLEH